MFYDADPSDHLRKGYYTIMALFLFLLVVLLLYVLQIAFYSGSLVKVLATWIWKFVVLCWGLTSCMVWCWEGLTNFF